MRKTIGHFILILFLSSLLSACSKDTEPFSLKFPVSFEKVGTTYNFYVKLNFVLMGTLDMCFYLTEPDEKTVSSSLSDKAFNHDASSEEKKQATRLEKILGYSDSEDHGVPAKFRVQLIDQLSGRVLLDKIIDQPKTHAGCAGRYARLFHDEAITDVYVGYTIRFTYLDGAPELAQVRGTLRLYKSYEHLFSSDFADSVTYAFPPQNQAKKKHKRAQAYRKLVDKSYVTLPECFREQFRESIYKRKIVKGMWASEALLAGAGVYRFRDAPEDWRKGRDPTVLMKDQCPKTVAKATEILRLRNTHQFPGEKMRKFTVRLEHGIVVAIQGK